MTNLLLVGPSQKIREHSKDYFVEFKNKDYKIISYSGSLFYLKDIGFIPDYFCFIDPFTLSNNFFRNEILTQKEFTKEIKVLHYNLYEEELKLFKDFKFTSSKFETIRYKTKFINKILNNYFNGSESHIPQIKSIFNLKNELIDFCNTCYVFSGEQKINIDKFFGALMPLALFHFKDVKNVECVGFGDFDVSRYDTGKDGDYDHYMESSKHIAPLLKRYLKEKEININFTNTNFFSKLLC